MGLRSHSSEAEVRQNGREQAVWGDRKGREKSGDEGMIAQEDGRLRECLGVLREDRILKGRTAG